MPATEVVRGVGNASTTARQAAEEFAATQWVMPRQIDNWEDTGGLRATFNLKGGVALYGVFWSADAPEGFVIQRIA